MSKFIDDEAQEDGDVSYDENQYYSPDDLKTGGSIWFIDLMKHLESKHEKKKETKEPLQRLKNRTTKRNAESSSSNMNCSVKICKRRCSQVLEDGEIPIKRKFKLDEEE